MDRSPAGKHLLDYWHVLLRRRWVVYVGAATVAATALVGSLLSTPLYRATATVQIERQNPDILTFRDLSRTDYSWAAYSDFYQTQYRILQSHAVAGRAAGIVDLAQHPSMEGDRKKGWMSRLRDLLPRRSGGGEPIAPQDAAAMAVLARLDVAPVRNSQLVHVSWTSEDPALAADVANAVVDAYIEYNLRSQFSTNEQATGFLVDQIAQLKEEIATLEDELRRYGESKNIVSADDANNITMRALSDIASRRTEAQTRLARAEATHRAIAEVDNDALPEVLQSSLIAELKADYAESEALLSQKTEQFKDDWPEVQALRSRLAQARERLELESAEIARRVRMSADSEYRQALAEVRNLDDLLRGQEAAAQQLRRDAVEFNSLQAEVREKRDTLESLISRQNEMALSTRLTDMDAASSNIRVVGPARVPRAPFRPNTRLNVVLGLMLGLGLGVAAAFFLDYLDNTLASPDEVATVTGLPALAVIPRYGGEDSPARRKLRERRAGAEPLPSIELVTAHDPRAPVSEAYRDLRTAILLSGAGTPPKRLMVSSAQPSEGKSATAVNLSVVLAQLGRRVLVIDTDLRKPRLHRVFGSSNDRGVSTFLSGLENDPATLTIPTEIPNLDVLPSGPIPPNPSELLDSPRFEEFGRQLLEAGYDHLVFDSPPTLSVADPVILANSVDAPILVVRAGSTPRQALRQAVDKYAGAGVRPVGVVLNDLPRRAGGYGAYRYAYEAYGEPDAGRRGDGDAAEAESA